LFSEKPASTARDKIRDDVPRPIASAYDLMRLAQCRQRTRAKADVLRRGDERQLVRVVELPLLPKGR